MTPEEEALIAQAQEQIEASQSQVGAMQNQQMQQAQWQEDQEKSMIKDQLDLTAELERIKHLLRGDIIELDENGIEYWKVPEKEEEKLLNELGVRSIMKTVSFYLNKNKLLSNYSEEIINQKMEDFATDLADLIFMRYREFGLDTSDKRKMYSMIVRELQDTIHDAYLRSLGGKERESLRRHMHVSESMGGLQNKPGGANWNPMNWLRR